MRREYLRGIMVDGEINGRGAAFDNFKEISKGYRDAFSSFKEVRVRGRDTPSHKYTHVDVHADKEIE